MISSYLIFDFFDYCVHLSHGAQTFVSTDQSLFHSWKHLIAPSFQLVHLKKAQAGTTLLAPARLKHYPQFSYLNTGDWVLPHAGVHGRCNHHWFGKVPSPGVNLRFYLNCSTFQIGSPHLMVDDKRLSANPLANFAKVFAEQGATTARSAHFLSSI